MLQNPLRRRILATRKNLRSDVCFMLRRDFSSPSSLSSGHNKWSKIKHDKGKNDLAKSKERSLLVKDLAESSKYGGDNPTTNPRLATAIANAKKAGFPKASVEAAIARGQGKSTSGAPLDTITIEAMVQSIALIFDCQTESKGRALQELRSILKDYEGSPTQTAYMFDKRGRIILGSKEGVGVDEVLEPALDAGALDVYEDEDGNIVVDTLPDGLKAAESAISAHLDLEVKSSDTIWMPNKDMAVPTAEEDTISVLRELNAELSEYPGVDQIYSNLTGQYHGRLPDFS